MEEVSTNEQQAAVANPWSNMPKTVEQQILATLLRIENAMVAQTSALLAQKRK